MKPQLQLLLIILIGFAGLESRGAEKFVTETVIYKQVGALAIKAEVHHFGDARIRPVIVWLHGGALINGHRESISAAVRQAALTNGWVLVSFDYRLAPESKLPEIIADIEDAFAWLRREGPGRFHIDPARIAVSGGSAGGYLALVTGHRIQPRPRVLLAFWGYGDLVGDWYATPSPHARHNQTKIRPEDAWRQVAGSAVADSRDRNGDGGRFYNFCRQTGQWPKAVSGWDPQAEAEKFFPFMPVKNVGVDYPPTVLIHGTADTDVPFEQSQMMAREFERQHVPFQLHSIAGGEHGLQGVDAARIQAANRQAIEFVKSHLEAYFPPARGEWEQVSPASVGWDAEKLERALAYAGQNRASGVVLVHRGRLLAERYWKPDEDARAGAKLRTYSALVQGRDAAGNAIEDVASVQKSVSAILTGIAQHRGLLALDDPVQRHLGRGWSKATPEQEQAITVRHLLTMTSGLKDDLTFEAAAGTRWRYNSAAYARNLMVVAAAAGKSRNELTREWLTGRIGMADSIWVERAVPDREAAANAVGFATSARDLARFGQLILNAGRWNGELVIADREFLQAALRPSQKLNPSYGYLWWLNGQTEVARGAGERVKGPLIPTAPADLVAALGAVDRKLYVVPSLELVVTRLGNSAGPAFQNQFWRLVMEAAPKP